MSKTPEQIAEEHGFTTYLYGDPHGIPNILHQSCVSALQEYGEQVRREERERCRQIAEDADKNYRKLDMMRESFAAHVVQTRIAALLEGGKQ
jgi:hypothetical protein